MTTVVSFGGGTNSTAMLVGLHERGERPDLILFADTGGEKPHTYDHVAEMTEWCVRVGFPPIIVVQTQDKDGNSYTLEERCLEHKMLPSIAYGFKACSEKHKRRPQDKYVSAWRPAQEIWARGERVTKLIGYDANEPHRAKIAEDTRYQYRYPLIEWDWGREECVEAIRRAGLKQPGKSACFFCPSSKKQEILWLKREHPELMDRAIAMEDGFRSNNWRECSLCGGGGQLTTKRVQIDEDDDGDPIFDFIACDPYQCFECLGKGQVESSVKGLGRDFAWADLVKFDEAQLDLFGESHVEIACDCYDEAA